MAESSPETKSSRPGGPFSFGQLQIQRTSLIVVIQQTARFVMVRNNAQSTTFFSGVYI